MSSFSFAIKEKNEETLNNITAKRLTPFETIFAIFKIIEESDINTYEGELDKLCKELDKSDFNFLVWLLNHHLLYNKFTRDNLDVFLSISHFLDSRDYLYYFVKTVILNEIKFPKFMAWYKLGLDGVEKKYSDSLKEEFKLKDSEIEDIIEYTNNKGLSIRDICLCLDLIKEVVA